MADCLLVLGANFLTQVNVREMELRTDKAVELYKQKATRKMILSGGYTHGSRISEASYMARRAMQQGVRRQDIVLEEQARTTIGNMAYAKEILKKRKWKSVIVVTSPHHVSRARNIANKVLTDYEVTFVKSRNLPLHHAIPKYVREGFAYLWYMGRPVDLSKK